jgi:hypothetical protein
MLSADYIDFRYLTKLVQEQEGDAAEPESSFVTIGDLGLTPESYVHLTGYLGSMMLGRSVATAGGDVTYRFQGLFIGKPHFLKFSIGADPCGISLEQMITEWVLAWYDAGSVYVVEAPYERQ